MAQVDTGEFPPAFKRVHGYAMIFVGVVTMVCGWAATWTTMQNHVTEVRADVSELRSEDARQQSILNENQKSLARIETSVQWIRETLASQKRNP